MKPGRVIIAAVLVVAPLAGRPLESVIDATLYAGKQEWPVSKGESSSANASGGAEYSIPIPLPPGRGGMTPTLAFTFDSEDQKPASCFPLGWNIRLPTIQRRGAPGRTAYEWRVGASRSPMVACDDAAARCAGVVGPGEFRLARDTGEGLRFFREADGWMVYDKAGQRSRFIGAGSSSWQLASVEDIHGNAVLYEGGNRRIEYTAKLNSDGSVAERGTVSVLFQGCQLIVSIRKADGTSEEVDRWECAGSIYSRDSGTFTRRAPGLPPATFSVRGDRTSYRASNPAEIPSNVMEKWAADFDGDGRDDVLLERYYTAGQNLYDVMLSSGTGFAFGWGIASTVLPIVADMDGDGRSDVITQWGAEARRVGYSTGTSFAFSIVPVAGPARMLPRRGVIVGDFNGDRRPDLAWQVGAGNLWRLETFDGSRFTATEFSFPAGEYLALDVNDDGRADWVTARTGTDGVVAVGLAGVSGVPAAPEPWITTEPKSSALAVGDNDDDGLPEIVYVACGAIAEQCFISPDDMVRGNFGSCQPVGRYMCDRSMCSECVNADCSTQIPMDHGYALGQQLVNKCDVSGLATTGSTLVVRYRDRWSPPPRAVFPFRTEVYESALFCFEYQGDSYGASAHWSFAPDVTTEVLAGGGLVIGDFNGNGASDIAYASGADSASSSRPWLISDGDGTRTVTVTEPAGGYTKIVLQPAASAVIPGWRNAIKKRVVTRIERGDGLGHVSVTSYRYGGGAFDPATGQFAGFRVVEEVRPEGLKQTTIYHQVTGRNAPDEHSDFRGMPASVKRETPDGLWVSEAAFAYTRNGTSGAALQVLVERSVVVESARSATSSAFEAGDRSTLIQVFGYDGEGNRVSARSEGDGGVARTVLTPMAVIRGLSGDSRRAVHRPQSISVLSGTGQKTTDTGFEYYAAGSPRGSEGMVKASTQHYTGVWTSNRVPVQAPSRTASKAYEYTPDGLVSSVTGPDGKVAYEYDPLLRAHPEKEQLFDRQGQLLRTSLRSFDLRTGQQTSETDGNGVTTSVDYDAWGRRKSVVTVTTSGERLAFSDTRYDDSVFPRVAIGRVQLSRPGDPEEWREERTYYDGLGRPVARARTAERGRFTGETWLYDLEGRQVFSEGPFHASGLGQPLTALGPGPWRVTRYLADGRVRSVTQSDGSVGAIRPLSDYAGSSDPALARAAEASGPTTTFDYGGRSVKVFDPEGRVHEVTRNAEGRAIRTRRYGPNDGALSVRFEEESDGRSSRVIAESPSGEVVLSEQWRDELGRVIDAIDANRDAGGGGARSFYYNEVGDLSAIYASNGQWIVRSYDGLHRLKEECRLPRSGAPRDPYALDPVAGAVCARKWSYVYDLTADATGPVAFGVDRLAEVSDGTVATRYRYDGLGRVIGETKRVGDSGEFVTKWEFDPGNRLRGVTYPNGLRVDETYRPDSALPHRLTASPGGPVSAFGDYDAMGGAQLIYRGDEALGRFDHIARDPYSGRPVSVERCVPGQSLGACTSVAGYRYDGSGRIRELSKGTGVTYAYQYDGLGRLLTETYTGMAPLAFTWQVESSSVMPHAPASVITAAGAYANDYRDSSGYYQRGAVGSGYDLRRGPAARALSYGDLAVAENEDVPAGMFMSGVGHAAFLYDHAGHRVRRVSPEGTTIYVGPHYEVRNGVPYAYVLAGGARVAVISQATGLLHIRKDHTNSTVALENASGVVTWTGEYTPFGALRQESGVRSIPYLFNDYEWDESFGLYYAGARYYDPAVGRFMAPDAGIPRPLDPASWNAFAFASYDPVNRIDPDGRFDLDLRLELPGDGNWEWNPYVPNNPHAAPLYPQPYSPPGGGRPNLSRPRIVGSSDRPAYPVGTMMSTVSLGRVGTLASGVGYSWWEFELDAGNFSAGFGSVVSLGLTDWINEQAGADVAIKRSSGAFSAGQWAGWTHTALTGLAGGLRAAGAKAVGKEFSHWIPNRLGGPRSLFNGNFVSAARHYFHDPFRYPAGWRSLGPKWPFLLQQLDRIPNAWKGLIIGVGWGSTGMAIGDEFE